MAEPSASPMLVLVHSPLVGPSTWSAVARRCRQAGRDVVVCSLAGITDDDGPYYRRLADAAVAAVPADPARPVVVVGHSGAGAVLPLIVDALDDHVCGTVFVDAVLPHPGQSWWEIAPAALREQLSASVHDGRLPRWHEWFPPGVVSDLLPDRTEYARFVAELPRLPIAYFTEPAPVTADLPAEHCAYLRLSAPYEQQAERARELGWFVSRMDADHLAMYTRPEDVAASLMHVSAAVIERGRP